MLPLRHTLSLILSLSLNDLNEQEQEKIRGQNPDVGSPSKSRSKLRVPYTLYLIRTFTYVLCYDWLIKRRGKSWQHPSPSVGFGS